MARKRADDLPARVEFVNGRYYYRPGALGRRAGERLTSIPLGSDREDARSRAQIIDRNLRTRKTIVDPRSARELLYQARHRAAAKGLPCDIDMEHIEELALANNGRCALSQIPFSPARGEYRASPWAMSIDRIESKGGYVKGNVRLVCYIVNVALNEWGVEALTKMARAVTSAHQPRAISRKAKIFPEGVSGDLHVTD